ncbi:MAG: NADH:ubiquinone oxidoreductase [Candidatus Thermoplasmatota archaeon]
MKKPKIAFFDFSSCEGCQLQVANLEEKIIDVAEVVEIVSFREIMKEHSDDYDIVFVEGSICRPIDEKRLKKIREKSKTVIALGACAHLGGVQRLSNKWSSDENKKQVYPEANKKDISDKNKYFEKPRHRALDEIIEVDYVIPGCPIDRDEFIKVLVALIQGKKPPIPDYPVCVECKKRENICLFSIGKFCMGPVARAGCGAICPTFGAECEACRGYVSHPHEKAQTDVLEEYGLDAEEIMNRKTMFTNKYVETKTKGEENE